MAAGLLSSLSTRESLGNENVIKLPPLPLIFGPKETFGLHSQQLTIGTPQISSQVFGILHPEETDGHSPQEPLSSPPLTSGFRGVRENTPHIAYFCNRGAIEAIEEK